MFHCLPNVIYVTQYTLAKTQKFSLFTMSLYVGVCTSLPSCVLFSKRLIPPLFLPIPEEREMVSDFTISAQF